MTPEAAALAVRLLPAALRVARSAAYSGGRPWLADEAESGALLWLVQAAIQYDPASGNQPQAYVLWIVRCRALNLVKWHRRRPAAPLPPALCRPDPDPLSRIAYDEATATLPPAHKRLVDLVCLSGLFVNEAAAREGISERSGCRRWSDLLRQAAPRLTA